MKKSMNPGQFNACQQMNYRVCEEVSTRSHLTVSATGRAYLRREQENRPENEDSLRGLKISPVVRDLLEEQYGPERIAGAIREGLLVV